MYDATMELSIFRYLEILTQNLDKQAARNRKHVVLHDRGGKKSVVITLLQLLLNQLCYDEYEMWNNNFTALHRDTTL